MAARADAMPWGLNVKEDERRWFVCVCLFVGSFFSLLAAAFLILFAIDPFDKGTGWAVMRLEQIRIEASAF